MGLEDIFGTNWGNATGTLRFNHIFNNKLFSNTSLVYSNFNYVVEGLDRNDGFKTTSKIADINFKQDFQYKSGEVVQHYLNLEPRFSLSYLLNEQQSIKASYNRNTQNIHLLTNSTSSSPTDLYVMSSRDIKPEIADQISTGYFRNFKDNVYEFSAEIYYKNLQNQNDYKDAAQLLVNQDVESQLVYGVGRAYGVKLFLKKKYGRFNGWVGYTWSKTERKFDEINAGSYT